MEVAVVQTETQRLAKHSSDHPTRLPMIRFLQAECPSCCPVNSLKALKTSKKIILMKISKSVFNNQMNFYNVLLESAV